MLVKSYSMISHTIPNLKDCGSNMEATAYVSHCDMTHPTGQPQAGSSTALFIPHTSCMLWGKTMMCIGHLDQDPVCESDHVVEVDCT